MDRTGDCDLSDGADEDPGADWLGKLDYYAAEQGSDWNEIQIGTNVFGWQVR